MFTEDRQLMCLKASIVSAYLKEADYIFTHEIKIQSIKGVKSKE